VRTEQEMFAELETLCTSPGYVHAIAFFCFRDTLVGYQNEMTAEDMHNMYAPERLARTEVSTLIGLMLKAEIDWDSGTPELNEQYISRTQELLEEIHQLLGHEMLGGLGIEEVLESRIDPFDSGTAFREPIFYSGETAYSFQYRDLAARRYAEDDNWLKSHKGFPNKIARDVVNALERLRIKKLTAVLNEVRKSWPASWSLLPGFLFRADEISRDAGIDESIVNRVLLAFSVREDEKNRDFKSLNDFNVANATPLLRRDDQTFVHFLEYSLAEALYDSPFYWMNADSAYRPTAMIHRGQFAEEFSRERLERVFGRQYVFSNVDIYESKGKKVSEIDVLVVFADRAIVLQAKSKKLTLEARKGNDNQIKDDFKKSVQDSYDQGRECASLLGNSSFKFIDGRGQELRLAHNFKAIYVFCIVSENYPALSFQVRQFLKVQTTDVIRAPFVMDIFTLDVMTEMLESPLYFLSYVDKRTGYADKLMASHELVLLSLHLKRNLWFEDKLDLVHLDDDISADLNVAMSVRRDHVPGKRTPDGILTHVANTSVGRILHEIESRADSRTLDLGFMLLMLGENAIIKISKAIDVIVERARTDGKSHDISIPLDEVAAGLTIHCNEEPLSSSGSKLSGHCSLRKYVSKVDEWHGVCLHPKDSSLRFGVSLNYKWEPDSKMDAFAARFRKPTAFEDLFLDRKRKIGRNERCWCNSGLKYKKCHGK
jgi:hypothetical protein